MEIGFTTLAEHPDWVPILADWYQTEWPAHFATRSPEEHLRAEMHTDRVPLNIVAVASGTPIGTVALRGAWEDAPGFAGPWLGGLYVHPEIRGHGVGTALVRVGATTAWNLGHAELRVGASHPEFFERIGWERAGQVESAGARVTVLRLTRPPSLYDELGGEAAVRRLVDRFYDVMDAEAEAAVVRGLHARSLKSSRDKLFKFLSGWTGGPNLYIEEYGHPRLRARHFPFEIGTRARDQWMWCMDRALDDTVTDEDLRRRLSSAFARIADHMRNREGE